MSHTVVHGLDNYGRTISKVYDDGITLPDAVATYAQEFPEVEVHTARTIYR